MAVKEQLALRHEKWMILYLPAYHRSEGDSDDEYSVWGDSTMADVLEATKVAEASEATSVASGPNEVEVPRTPEKSPVVDLSGEDMEVDTPTMQVCYRAYALYFAELITV